MNDNYYKAFIRVVKSFNKDIDFYGFGAENIVEERLIQASSKTEVKEYLLNKYPQFFQNNKIYEKETKDTAQFFYVVIYPLFSWEINLINQGSWTCAHCGQVYENKYLYRPRYSTKHFGDDVLFCGQNEDLCLNNYKREYYKNIELPDDDIYISKDSPNYIYKITEKASNKCYIGKTRNEPFFRWWNHLKHSSSPFGIYLRSTKISDWTFEVIDILPAEATNEQVLRIESEYILKNDSIKNGFNSLISSKKAELIDTDQQTLKF